MAASNEFKEFVAEQLHALGPVRIRSMFGGAGVFLHDVMFGLIADDVLYLRADQATSSHFDSEGMTAFTHETRGRTIAMPYWTVPDRLFDDADEMIAWARQAYDVALKARKS